ncbi:BolA family protein [Aliiroseovarius sp. PTFE2010]|uniref:BolA family protein n=1 Tax=Aliiroseovarius sp. PTFE2010 TaxID=3417190 RepID=UPI003CEC64DA
MSMTDQIRDRLQAAFSPSVLEVVDDSERHRGHAGFQEGGESHFNVTISSADFADMSRIAQHRAIHAALGDDIMARIHALSLSVDTKG